jgi:hypothetical protein
MPLWLTWIVLPIAKLGLKTVLMALEKKHPGWAPVIDKVLGLLKAGVSPAELESHIDQFTVVGRAPDLKGE